MDEHIPVLVDEVLDALALEAGGFYVDATFGRGGHTARILEALGPQGHVLAVDRDPEAIAAGRARFAGEVRLAFCHAPFAELRARVHAGAAGRACRGVLFDLGVSSPQLDSAARGFSFQKDGPLDMRMDPSRGEPVSAWLARAGIDEIAAVIRSLGEERFARRIARAIDVARHRAPLRGTAELAALVARAVPTREPGKHPATRTFQALRMHVNDELGQLRSGLEGAVEVLAPGGRLAVISFHSLEDRLVKQFLRDRSVVNPALAQLPHLPAGAEPQLRLVGRKRRPTAAELAANPRARSAILRVAEKQACAQW
ncbi:MAG: 16S rRNA (cytosine(1402)-N(4))-methyltransferase RsmH [Gammaproteobacteria bacterium]|nr:16S rRNA (cytosine(1402)-N(4))-methyltransferase RsmH [Gammaproteobacteria bacterium]